MWQDGLALFIVVIAALTVLRAYGPVKVFRFGARQRDDGSIKRRTTSTGGCNGCAAGGSCAKTLIRRYPVAIQQHD
ncbi:MAG: hypothetical protein KDJ34_01780 [Candidatus Competibacteraceae bacterium]|nr:hypothetical protein [Candidatus Competibacteraceae bacterium]MCP5133712.1 hypothetical protein [Gammaproteobacteria bacterium]